jgi:hypothetical protein
MIQRCGDKLNPWYGGRGIDVCAAWKRFDTFLLDMGRKPSPEYSIERLENSKGYCKNNCVWADSKTQSRNTRTNRFLTFKGDTLTVVDWSERMGIKRGTLYRRLYLGWSVEQALSKPTRRMSE